MSDKVSRDRFLGCLLGQAIGDGLGARYEGLPDYLILETVGTGHEIVKNPTGDILYYTDDTQMMIGVAETLIVHGQIVMETLCRAFATNYDPARGYGQGARKILEAMVTGEDWQEIARTTFPRGSFGNGAAMRVAPIGIFFCDDHDQVMEQAALSALPTHHHPLGIEGAQLLALAVALAARTSTFNRAAFYRELRYRCESEEFEWQLRTAQTMAPHHSISVFGTGLEAHRSVVTAIACFTHAPDSYAEVIGKAVSLGNDTDTLAAMAGATSGAYLGMSAIPSHLLEKLEEQHKGRSYIQSLAERLHGLYAG
jgi:poly(ADP-ribose) glycohydrolase ARH3